MNISKNSKKLLNNATIFSTLAAGLLFFMLPASSAFASTGPFTITSTGSSSAQAANLPISTSISSNWAGYVADSGNNYTSVSGTWIVPNASTSEPVAADATWVGIGGMDNRTDLIQAGTQAIIDNGVTTYAAWYETLPQASTIVPLTIHAGDTITTALNETSPNRWSIVITDATTNQQYSTTINYTSSLSSAEWIQEMPSELNDDFFPLDDFGQIPFTNASTVQNNSSENLVQSGARALTIVGSDNRTVYAYPSAIGSDGSSFTVTRNTQSVLAEPQQQVVQQNQNVRGFFRRDPWQQIQSFTNFPLPNQAQASTSTYTSGGMTMTITTYSF